MIDLTLGRRVVGGVFLAAWVALGGCSATGGAHAAAAVPSGITSAGEQGIVINGRVFEDRNGNGTFDRGDRGIAGVGVSDTIDLVQTGKDGTYALNRAKTGPVLLYISLPSGYSKSSTFYRHVKPDSPAGDFDFALTKADERKTFSFAQISDIHIGGSGTKALLEAALKDIAALKSPPAFALATGDLADKGANLAHYEAYVAGISTSKIPVFSVIGNHDLNNRTSDNYRRFLGPDYYSFDYGDCHFLCVNSMQDTKTQREWIKKDMKLLRGKKRLFIFQHYSPSEEDHQRFAALGAEAVFSGHWHSQHTVRVDEMTSYNTGNLLFGGIDCSPAGFKMIHVDRNRSNSRMRWLADGKRLTIVMPSDSLVIGQDDLQIVVNAYETSADITAVEYQVKADGKRVANGKLSQKGEWTWEGTVSGGKLKQGAYELEIAAVNDKGEVNHTHSHFNVTAGRKPTAAPQGEWAQFGGGPQRGGLAAGPLEPPLGPVWHHATGASFDFASPVLKDGSLYVGLKDRSDFDLNGVLALRAADAQQQWFTHTPAAVSHSVTVDDLRVYANSHGGIMHAFDRSSGKEIWSHELGSDTQRWQYSGPVLDNGRLYSGTLAHFGAFNPEDGKPFWERRLGPDWLGSNSAPAVKGNIVIATGNSRAAKSVQALNTDTGKTLWEYSIAGLHGSPVISGDSVVFTSYAGMIVCLDLQTGKEKWKHKLEGNDPSATTPAVSATGVVVAGGTGRIDAYRLSDGKPLWNKPIGTSALKMSPYNNTFAALVGSPTIAGNIAYVPCGDGKLYALDVEKGEERWSMNFGTPLLSAPAIVGDRMYITAFDGTVYALAAKTAFEKSE